jgi:hypothetical protein
VRLLFMRGRKVAEGGRKVTCDRRNFIGAFTLA